MVLATARHAFGLVLLKFAAHAPNRKRARRKMPDELLSQFRPGGPSLRSRSVGYGHGHAYYICGRPDSAAQYKPHRVH